MSISGASEEELRAPIYMDFNATSPVSARVADEVMHYMTIEFGNAGSRTHRYGQAAKVRVREARAEIARLVNAEPEEVVFTSGATESNNLALLGLAEYGKEKGKKHIISTSIEHHAILGPLEHLQKAGFEVELLPPNSGGWVPAESIINALRPDTLAVSMMAVNNETGVIQPIQEIADLLGDKDAYFHVDAAQAYGKLIEPLQNKRIDLLSFSGHKIGAPAGVGGLVARRRGYRRPPLTPIMFGGGQERGLRPGTLPVALIAGLGLATTIASQESGKNKERGKLIKETLLSALKSLGAVVNGDPERTIYNTVNVSIPGLDSEAAIVALKDIVAISNGSACTSQSYEPSHVLSASGTPSELIDGALRFSWGPELIKLPINEIVERLSSLLDR